MVDRRSVEELITKIESELGISNAVIFVRGKPMCSEVRCITVFVQDFESFEKALIALVRQGISTGGLPIIVVENEKMDSVDYWIVDYIDGLMIIYSTSRK
ncbi:hypothetical protein QPL79_02105 [Ignisphaera sp. 4213-co]|uniref:Divalent-cation tolerance protein CutA n=1 Tax=Ignisphaera cupida TaxID=3050454 RepID=A0ABD4Z6A6_9CREN|nr:hypothetical protein [Ignisphaera sp. 4213-co]MDK6028158.1 hypothetical protein [Ignisphaera sp. 4213-co]